MALFFDADWFDARLNERGLNKLALSAILGVSQADLDAMWKDQREISMREVTLLAEMLGVAVQEISERGGVSTPVPKPNANTILLARLDALEARVQRLEGKIPG